MTETSSTLNDVIMTSSIDLVERSGVLNSHISDHYLVYALLKLKISKNLSKRVLTRLCSIGDTIESCQKIKQSRKQGTNCL